MRKNTWVVAPINFIPTICIRARVLLLAGFGLLATTWSTRADQQIYTDSLQNGWQDWSWATHDLNQTGTKRSGTSAISVNSSAWSALSFWHSPQNANQFVSFSFWIHGGTSGGQALQVYAEKDGVGLPGVAIPAPAAGTWQQVTLSLDSLGLTGATNMTRFNIFNVSGNTLPTFYIDDVSLISDSTPPVVQNISPAAGTISNLTTVTVNFSEPVTGVDSGDLRLNGAQALSMSGSGSNYIFTYAPPAEGVLAMTWFASHGITDLASPANAFNATGPGATWQYNLVDTIPPVMTQLFPAGGALLGVLSQIEVTFSETVLGVNASDLLINGSPATNVTKLVGQPYVFKFPPPPTGTVSVAWATNHGITDAALTPNAFVGGGWSYTLNTNLTLPDLVINEILAANISTNGLADEDGSQEDWIEIYNRGSQAVNLANWSLSDDPALPGLWTFPARTLNPGQYLIVFASGKDRRPTSTSSNLHTNFKLAIGGEPLGLYSADSPRQLVSGFDPFPEQRNGVSYGRDLFGQLRYFATPTPGAANGASSIIGVIAPVHVNVNRGHFTTPFTLTASCPTPGATLRYTTDGSEPTASSTVFPASLQISTTTLFRIAAFKANYLPSKTKTHTYFFNLPENLRSLPAISIVTASNHLYGPNGILGINGGYFDTTNQGGLWISTSTNDYHNPSKHGLAWERETSVEWIQPEDNSGFQVECGLRVQGSDWQRPRLTPSSKYSFRLYFRSDYGDGRLNYPAFPLTGVESFDQLVLRAGFNEQYNPFIRDEFHRRLSHDMGSIASHGTLAVVFVNGQYYSSSPWYNPTERVHEEFFQEHLGGGDDWDVVGPSFASSSGLPGVIDGDRVDFLNLVSYVNNNTVTTTSVYTNIARWLDLTNFADYCLLNAYAAMGDWPANNWRAGKDRNAAGPWRFVVWDAEWGMGIYDRSININSFTETGGGPGDSGLASVGNSEIAQLYDRLRASPEFQLLWADRVQKHFFNDGALMPAAITNRFNELRDELLPLMPNMDIEILQWANDRQPIFFGQMEPFGLTAYTNAPSFNQHGGRVAPGFNLVITNTGGTIYYTTNGADPRVAFTGAVTAGTLTYTGPVALNNTVTIRSRARNGSTWSAINEATFTVGSLGIPLRITEIMYNPAGGSLYEFLELQNTSGVAVNLGGMYLDGINFIFTEGTTLAGGARLVLGVNTDTNAWKALYTGVNPVGWFSGNLNNSGERISLFDKFGNLITSVDYLDNGGWPTAADGGGRSLEVIAANGDPDAPANWKASAANNGTPGAANSAAPAQPVYLNEVMADNVSAVNHSGTFPDYVELRNPGVSSVNITGWSLTDDGNARKFVFPSTTIPAGGYLTVWCDATTNTTPGLHTGFSLDKDGDHVFLYDATTNRIDALSFGLQVVNKSVGRISSVWTLNNPTTNAVNAAATLAAASNLVMNEWLANPTVGLPDWVELFNNSAAAPVSLQGIYLSTSNNLHQLTALAFLAPKGYVQLFADEGVGADHLDFKLPASGEKLVLSDATGGQIQSVTYVAQIEGVSQGRLPDGNSNVTNFIGSLSPETTNYIVSYTGPVINEVLARNRSLMVGTQIVDFVEIQNPNGSSFNLGGMSLSVNAQQAGEFIFPSPTTIAANGFLLIKCDGSTPASTNAGAFNTGESLDGESGGIYLFNTNSQVVNFVEYGLQVDNLSIGLSSGQWRLLSAVTPTAVNAVAAVLGNTTALRLNEWMPDAANGNDDWFELFNTTNRPVDLSAASLSDDPSLVGQGMFRPAPLSFIGPTNFVKWVADNNAGNGRNHVNFALAGEGESLLVYNVVNGTNFTLVDALGFGAQTNGVSSGRLLDGATNILAFPG
ncbi:MAG: lamin tail domain-containing protein, partial [Verrucomicrobiota bacterium]